MTYEKDFDECWMRDPGNDIVEYNFKAFQTWLNSQYVPIADWYLFELNLFERINWLSNIRVNLCFNNKKGVSKQQLIIINDEFT